MADPNTAPDADIAARARLAQFEIALDAMLRDVRSIVLSTAVDAVQRDAGLDLVPTDAIEEAISTLANSAHDAPTRYEIVYAVAVLSTLVVAIDITPENPD